MFGVCGDCGSWEGEFKAQNNETTRMTIENLKSALC